jgi:glycosyltransferase involved in cell wall biosynthesis
MPRVDLQVHSSYSDRPSEWILRKLGVPESYTRPEDLHRKLKERGCDFVTITDHNRIDGCLAIADRPDVFISEEVTTYFPEDGCKIHLLVWNLTERQHQEIASLRKNIYELSAYLRKENLVHGVSHPLYSVNKKLTVDHFEKLILLFRVFEGLNGTREPLAQEIATLCLGHLNPGLIDAMANRQNLAPTHAEPWKKSLIGGSDDHGGLYMGLTWTETPAAATVSEFLKNVEQGNCAPGGQPGDALRFSNSIYNIILSFAHDRMGKAAPKGLQLLSKIAQRFFEGKNPTDFSFGERAGHVFEAIRSGKAFEMIKPGDPSFNKEIAMYFMNPRVKGELDTIIAREPSVERRMFCMASKIANDLSYRMFNQSLNRMNKGDFVEALQPLIGMLPVMGSLSPYLFSFYSLHSNRPLLESTAKRILPKTPEPLRNIKRAWFTDTLEDVNGVARTIQTMALSANKAGASLTVATSRSEILIKNIPVKNFTPVGEFEIPEYELQKLSFPPMLEIVDYIEREKFTECIISTPGPIGLTSLAAAKLLGLRTVGIYHTDFPQYVRILSDDEFMETLAWKFMHWFYSQFDLVYVNSNFYRQCWIDRGIPAEKLAILPRGIDTELFNPKHRDAGYWKKRGAKGPVVLYVGRISKEKDLGFLAEVAVETKKRGVKCTFAFVGEGPYREELQTLVPDAIFTGILTGRELGIAYASADFFAFPSTTDTFGNVVVEATSSGLPVLVSDIGGPKELIPDGTYGKVIPAKALSAWADAVQEMVTNPISRDVLVRNASTIQAERSWDKAFDQFWANGLEKA